jgi:hypothetical protein
MTLSSATILVDAATIEQNGILSICAVIPKHIPITIYRTNNTRIIISSVEDK